MHCFKPFMVHLPVDAAGLWCKRTGQHAGALELMCTILSWDFRRSTTFVLSFSSFASSPALSSSAPTPPPNVHLPGSWVEHVLARQLLDWLLSALLHRQEGGSRGRLLALLVQMCSLAGKALEQDHDARRAAASFCVRSILAVWARSRPLGVCACSSASFAVLSPDTG